MLVGVGRAWCCVDGVGGIVQLFVERREHISNAMASRVLGAVVTNHPRNERSFPSRLDGTDALEVPVLFEDGADLLSSFGAFLLSNVFLYCFADRPSSVRVCGWDIFCVASRDWK